MMEEPKRLYRSETNKIFSGICGGIGEYMNIDPAVVRALYVVMSLASIGFPGLIVYIVLHFVIPVKPFYK